MTTLLRHHDGPDVTLTEDDDGHVRVSVRLGQPVTARLLLRIAQALDACADDEPVADVVDLVDCDAAELGASS